MVGTGWTTSYSVVAMGKVSQVCQLHENVLCVISFTLLSAKHQPEASLPGCNHRNTLCPGPSENCTDCGEVGEQIQRWHNCFHCPFLGNIPNEFELKTCLFEFGYTSNVRAATAIAVHLKWQKGSCLLFPVSRMHAKATCVSQTNSITGSISSLGIGHCHVIIHLKKEI